MVLEPIAPPRVGQVLNLLGAITFGAATIVGGTLGSVNGSVPFIIFTALLTIGFALRFGGLTYAISKDEWTMPWGPRIVSWLAFGGCAVLLGTAGALLVVAGFAGFVVIDAATGFVKREVEPKPKKAKRSLWSRVKLPLFVTLYAAFVVAFHFYVSIYLSYGVLVTWTLISLGFVVVLRAALVGAKAPESWLRAPGDHRLHEKREEAVPDPYEARAEQVLLALRARGDAGAFIQFVQEAAREAGMPPSELTALDQRILQTFARAGTRRDEDIAAALGEVERFLSLRKVTPS